MYLSFFIYLDILSLTSNAPRFSFSRTKSLRFGRAVGRIWQCIPAEFSGLRSRQASSSNCDCSAPLGCRLLLPRPSDKILTVRRSGERERETLFSPRPKTVVASHLRLDTIDSPTAITQKSRDVRFNPSELYSAAYIAFIRTI